MQMIVPVVLSRLLKFCSKTSEVIQQNAVNGWESQFVLCCQRPGRSTTERGTRNLMWTEELFTSRLPPGPPFHGPPLGPGSRPGAQLVSD
jgi:hypothetical protein